MASFKQLALGLGCTIICSYLLAQESAPEGTASLTVLVEGARAEDGQALAALFNSEESFLKEPLSMQILPIDENGSAAFLFEDLTAGSYAVSVVYDEDSDGELDTGFLGIPSEPVAISNNAAGRFGPPSFEDAEFQLAGAHTITLYLHEVE